MPAPPVVRLARIGAVAALLLLCHGVQVQYLRNHPQPILFGDAQSYFVVGQRMSHAVAAWRAGGSLADAVESVRGVLYFTGVGAVYAVIDAMRPRDVPFAREALAGFNTLAALGVFLLARRLTGSFGWGLVALAGAALYPPFSVQTGRLLPDPITGCCFVFAAWLYAEAVARGRAIPMALAGVALTAGLLVRSQLFNWVLVLVVVCLVVTARWWWREVAARRQAAALVLGLLPLSAAWFGIVALVGDDVREVEALGNFTYRPRYPYGFWQFLDSDGWMGSYRLEEEPYYRALEQAAATRPELLESRPRQWLFTAGYVRSRLADSALLVLDNAWRLYDRPANDYKRDYPFGYGIQVVQQRAILLLALAGAVWLGARRRSWLGVLFLPAALALLHALSYPWPRFNQPAMPILLAVAVVGLAGLAQGVRERARAGFGTRRELVLLGLGLLILAAGLALRLAAPELARVLRWLGAIGLLGVPLLLAAPASTGGRLRPWPVAVWLALASVFSAHALRDRRWHEHAIDLARAGRVEQVIQLDAAALARLRSAPELFLVLDLWLPGGDPTSLALEVAGRAVPGSALVPTMPRFGESTAAGGRNRFEYPQWWALPLEASLLPEHPGELRVVLEAPAGRAARLGADRFAGEQAWYEGPSFGDWPHRAAVKLEYDGDYRLPMRLPLGSRSTRSWVGRGGARRALAGVHRIRILALENRGARAVWEAPPTRATGPAAFGFFAYSGTRGTAALSASGAAALRFPLPPPDAFRVSEEHASLCHRAAPPRGGMAYGGYLVTLDSVSAGQAVRFEVAFRPGMSDEGMFFSLDAGRTSAADLAPLAAACDAPPGIPVVAGFARPLDLSRNSYPDATGRWAVAGVY
jgi:hypothetical protein